MSTDDLDSQMMVCADRARSLAGRILEREIGFSTGELAVVDEMVQLSLQGMSQAPESADRIRQQTILDLGAFLGEILRRDLGGAWTLGGAGLPDHLPAVALGPDRVPPMVVVQAFLEGEPVGIGDDAPSSAVDLYRVLKERGVGGPPTDPDDDAEEAEAWIHETVLGEHDSPESLLSEMSADPDVAGEVVNTLANALATGEARWDVRLDLTTDSLEPLESILGSLADTLREDDGDGPTDEQVHQVIVLWGAFLGEVIRRRLGGTWMFEDGVLWLRIRRGEDDAVDVHPLARVNKRIHEGEENHVGHFVRALESQL